MRERGRINIKYIPSLRRSGTEFRTYRTVEHITHLRNNLIIIGKSVLYYIHLIFYCTIILCK